MQGFHVGLFEREVFPRHHVGESLLPASMPILETLGVADAVAGAGFLQKWGASMVWGLDDSRWRWRFDETNKRYPHAYQVHRDRFDEILLRNSASHGVEVHEGCAVREVDERADCVVLRTANGHVEARFVVDASGQTALLGSRAKVREWDTFFRNIAFYAYFGDVTRLPGEDANNILIEAHEHGWTWTIPLAGGTASVGVVLDAQQAAHEVGDPAAFMAGYLDQCPETSRLLGERNMVDGPYVERDWSYASTRMVGPRHVLVGDAACFVDPLFSSGVHLAMSGAVLASGYVTTWFRNPDFADAAAAEYERLYRQQFDHFYQLARLFYSSNRTHGSYFWEARRILRDEQFSPRDAFVRAVAGQPPMGYERVVLAHGDLPAEFTDSVDEVVGTQQSRRAALAALGGEILQAKPTQSPGLAVAIRPLLEDGAFVPARTLVSDLRPEGVPCSPLVETVVALSNGEMSVQDMAGQIGREVGRGTDDVLQVVVDTVSILVVEGMLEVAGPGRF